MSYEKKVSEYIGKNVENKFILGPFICSPIQDLCFSPLMTVPKEEDKRRIVVDFSFPLVVKNAKKLMCLKKPSSYG